MKKNTTTTKINYAILPQALRLAASAEAVARVKAGESATEVAKAFGTTLALVNSWVKRDSEGTLGKRLHDDKVTARELGTSQLSVRRWMESEEQGFNGYAKRGRKARAVEAEVSTEVTVIEEVQG